MSEILPLKNEKLKAVILFGPPGSGKGTLGKILCAAGNHVHLSSGDIFRGLDPESPGGKIFHQYASKGLLVPDEVTIQIWHHYVEGLVASNRYFPHQQLLFLDGLPRTLKQAEALDQFIDLVQVIVLDIADSGELHRRLLRRGTIEKRQDDQDLEVLKTRLQVYENQTVKLLNHYPTSLISHFNALQRPIEVLCDVLTRLTPIL